MDFSVLENAIVAKISHSQETFRFFRPAFSDPSLIEGGFAILKRVGMEQMADRKTKAFGASISIGNGTTTGTP